ncbi:MAG: DUF975 family protein [Porcipelethomonas sp.]
MFDRKEAKKHARGRLKKHYWIFVAACLIASFIGVEYALSLSIVKTAVNDGGKVISEIGNGRYGYLLDLIYSEEPEKDDDAIDVFAQVASKNPDKGKEISDGIVEKNKNSQNRYLRTIEMGRQAGVFAEIANTISSGSVFVSIFTGIHSIIGNENGAVIVFIVLSILVLLFVWAYIFNVYKAVYRRAFLEGLVYEKVSIKSFIHFIRVKKYFKAATTVLLTSFFKTLWGFTIAGGFIKYFSYFLVPYIVAENPDISPRDAIKLSQSMMNGHKFECFKMKLSFIGWYILEGLSLGTVGIFFLNPYQETFFTEYYSYLRTEAKKNGIENAELLNDEYLYRKAEPEKLQEAYSDIVKLSEKPEPAKAPVNAVWRFFANIFGIVPFYSKVEQEYSEANLRKVKINSFKSRLAGEAYPGRLNPIPEKMKVKEVTFLNYNRHYSICSLVLMFFLFSFFGWFWEVCFHLVQDGEFVNRGILHGPWLPIYGSGGLMILLLLNKLRSKPVIEFLVSILLCGVVEYFTGYFLEEMYGERWWDYSGYFMNIDGRVCAEGLLVFGIGGAVFVYFIAPLTDNIFRKIRLRYIIPICAVLMIAFVTDQIYSSVHPNIGAGITEYEIPDGYTGNTERFNTD